MILWLEALAATVLGLDSPLAGVVLGGAVALAGSFFAQRYSHVLTVRSQHHDDFQAKVLEPWLKELDKMGWILNPTGEGLERMAKPEYMEAYSFRHNDLVIEDRFPPNTPLWDQSKKHWPELARLWDRFMVGLEELDSDCFSILRSIESSLPHPPPGAFWDQCTSESDPTMDVRWATTEIWGIYWRSQNRYAREGLGVEEAVVDRVMKRTFWRFRNDWDETEQKDQSLLRDAAIAALFSKDLQEMFQKVLHQLDYLYKLVSEMQALVRCAVHNRNLPGHCSYCPRLIRQR